MDPAALGTTMIGLDAIRQDEARDRRAQAIDARRPHRSRQLRRQLADALRWTARRIDTAPVPAA
jgi:hypothetical protein